MKEQRIADALNLIDEIYIEEAAPLSKTRKTINWLKWLGVAACLCLVISLSVFVSNQLSNEGASCDEIDAPPITLNGITYYASSVTNNFYDSCPEGFYYAGEIEDGAYAGVAYYTNPEHPEQIYLYIETYAHKIIYYGQDIGSINPAIKEMLYVRFSDIRISARHFVSYNDQLYLAIRTAITSGDNPDISREEIDKIKNDYGSRIEAESVEGFESVGFAEFCGYDFVPSGELSCNIEGGAEVFANPNDDFIILVPTTWYSRGDNGKEIAHYGYDVYFQYSLK